MPLALSRTGVVFKKCYINNAGDFNRLARNIYKVLLTRGTPRLRDLLGGPGDSADAGLTRPPDAVALPPVRSADDLGDSLGDLAAALQDFARARDWERFRVRPTAAATDARRGQRHYP